MQAYNILIHQCVNTWWDRKNGASGENVSGSDYRSAQLIVTGSSSSIATTHESSVNYWELLGNGGNNSYEGHSLQLTFYPRKSTMEDGHGNSFVGSGTRTDSGSNLGSLDNELLKNKINKICFSDNYQGFLHYFQLMYF